MLKTDEKDNLFHFKQFKEWLVKRVFFCFFSGSKLPYWAVYTFFYISQKVTAILQSNLVFLLIVGDSRCTI